MPPLLTDRYRDRLAGILSCDDRMVITGTLPGACIADGMTKLLSARGIRIFDYPKFAAELRDRVRAAATAVAAAAGVAIGAGQPGRVGDGTLFAAISPRPDAMPSSAPPSWRRWLDSASSSLPPSAPPIRSWRSRAQQRRGLRLIRPDRVKPPFRPCWKIGCGTGLPPNGATFSAISTGCRKSSLSRTASASLLPNAHPTTGVAGKLFQAVGVALPPNIQELPRPAPHATA